MGRKTPATKYKEAKLKGYVQEIERLVGKKVGRIVRREIPVLWRKRQLHELERLFLVLDDLAGEFGVELVERGLGLVGFDFCVWHRSRPV